MSNGNAPGLSLGPGFVSTSPQSRRSDALTKPAVPAKSLITDLTILVNPPPNIMGCPSIISHLQINFRNQVLFLLIVHQGL